MNKINWEKPELVILTKGQPEESVLKACKMVSGFTETGPGDKKVDRRCLVRESAAYVDCHKRAFT